jgi:hypothetical protein
LGHKMMKLLFFWTRSRWHSPSLPRPKNFHSIRAQLFPLPQNQPPLPLLLRPLVLLFSTDRLVPVPHAMLTPRVLKLSLLRRLRVAAELPPPWRPRYASIYSLVFIAAVVFVARLCLRAPSVCANAAAGAAAPRWHPRLLEVLVWAIGFVACVGWSGGLSLWDSSLFESFPGRERRGFREWRRCVSWL